MKKVTTLYNNYQEFVLDSIIFGKISSTPVQSIEELKEYFYEDFKIRKPYPTLEDKRYELSRLVAQDYKILYDRELDLQDNEVVVDLNASAKSQNIDFSDLKPLIPEAIEVFSYQNNITDSLRKSIIEKYDLDTGEEFEKGVYQTEKLVGSVEIDTTTVLTDEEIESLGSGEVTKLNQLDFSSHNSDSDEVVVDEDFISYDSEDDLIESDDEDDIGLIDEDDDISEEDDDFESDDDIIEESDDFEDDDFVSDTDDYLDEDGSDSDSVGSGESQDLVDGEDDVAEAEDDDLLIDDDDEDYYSEDNDDEITEDYTDDSDDEIVEDESDDLLEEDDSDDYIDDGSESDYCDDTQEEGSDLDSDDFEIEFEEPKKEKKVSSGEVFDPLGDEDVEIDIPIPPQPVVEVPKPVQVQEVVEEEPTDLRKFLRKHPRCEYAFALKYFSKKQIDDAIKIGKIVKRGNILKL